MFRSVAFCGGFVFPKLKYFIAIILRIRHCSLLALAARKLSYLIHTSIKEDRIETIILELHYYQPPILGTFLLRKANKISFG